MIDGTHIPLSAKPNKQITSSIVDFYNRKRFHNIVLQAMCDCDIFFGMHVLVNQGEWQMEDNSKCQICINLFDQDKFCKNQLLLLKVCKFNLTYLRM